MGIEDRSYQLFEVPEAEDLREFLEAHRYLKGLNVTIPYKKAVIPFLDRLEHSALSIGAVNCIARRENLWVGANTDGPAFLKILQKHLFLLQAPPKALILGDGGAASAIRWALGQLGIPSETVSRKAEFTFEDLDVQWNTEWNIIIQCTPVGMAPETEKLLPFPFYKIRRGSLVFDLIYNPEKTKFLYMAEQAGAICFNGMEMLLLQADLGETFWFNET